MAKLPAYTNQQQLDTGSDTFRLAGDAGAAVASGFKAMGDGLAIAGRQMAKTDAGINAKAGAVAERDAGYRDEAAYIRLGDQIQQYAVAQRDKVTDDAAGYTKSVEEFAQKTYAEYQAKGLLSGNNPDKHNLMFERVRNSVIDKAATYEADTKMKFRADVYEKRLGDLVASAASGGIETREQAVKEWTETVARLEDPNSRLGRKFLEIGEARINRAAFETTARKRALEFMAKFQGIYTKNPSATSGNDLVDATLKYAPANGIDPRWAVAIGHIESRLNSAHDGPLLRPGAPRALGRKGATHMSSAEGGWQILDDTAREFGLTIDEKKDPELSTAAVMKHFGQNQRRLESKQQEVTPGKVYMMWNVGQGVAENILNSDPSRRIENIIYASYPSNPARAAQVLRNNPYLYKAGMTAGQVIQSYENKMDGAIGATSKFFDGTVTTDAQTQGFVKEFVGTELRGVGTKDVAEIFASVAKNVKEQTAKEAELAQGEQFLFTPGAADVHSEHDRKAINAAVEARVGNKLVQGIMAGDVDAHGEARSYIAAAGFIPDKVMHGYRSAMHGSSTEAAMLAMQSLAEVQRENPQAFGASKLQPDEKAIIDDFAAYTRVLGRDPATAAKMIMAEKTPEGKAAKAAMAVQIKKEWLNGGREEEAHARAWTEITVAFGRSRLSSPDTATDVQRESLVQGYKRGADYYRLQGDSAELAKAKAMDDLRKVWGMSSVSSDRAQTFMPFPPEKVLGPTRALDGSFNWVKEQARNHLNLSLLAVGKAKLVDPDTMTIDNAPAEFRLVPTMGAADDWRARGSVKYDVYYKDKNGMIQRAPGMPFEPNFQDAKRHDEEKFRTRRDVKEMSGGTGVAP